MAVTSGLTAFNLDLNEIMEEAYERAGLEIRTGYEFRTGRRSLNMLTIEWANRGINLWTIEQGQIVMNTGQGIYPFPEDTIDLLDQVIRTQANDLNQIDINISRISESTYAMIPNKLAQGRPIQVWINRQTGAGNSTTVVLTTALTSTDTTVYVSDVTQLAAAGFINVTTSGVTETIVYQNVNPVPLVGLPNAGQLLNCARGQNGTVAAAHTTAGTTIAVTNLPSINVWPTPNSPGDQYIFVYWRMRRLQDAGSGVNIQDIPFRFIPCLVAGLAFYIASKRPEIPADRVMFLKQEYEQQWLLASQEDREKAPDRFVPRQLFY
jgi:hypothetical protein